MQPIDSASPEQAIPEVVIGHIRRRHATGEPPRRGPDNTLRRATRILDRGSSVPRRSDGWLDATTHRILHMFKRN